MSRYFQTRQILFVQQDEQPLCSGPFLYIRAYLPVTAQICEADWKYGLQSLLMMTYSNAANVKI